MNEATESGQANELLRRRWGVTGGQGPVFTIASDVFPGVQLDEVQMDPENLFLAGSRRASQTTSIDPAPGQRGVVGIFSPPAGNTLVVVERILILQATAGDLFNLVSQSPGTTALTSTVAGTLHDSRWGAALSTGLMGSASIAAGVGAGLATIQVVTTELDMLWTHVLAPGANFTIQGPVDRTFPATIVWRERRLGSWEIVR